MESSPENPNQLPPPGGSHSIQPQSGTPRTIDSKPATVPVTAGTSVITDIGNNAITERAEDIRYSSDETMVWQETPSLALLVPRAVKYLIWLAVIFILCAIANNVVSGNPSARSALEQNGVRTTAPAARHAARKAKSRRSAAVPADADAATSPDASTSDAASSSDAAPAAPAQPWTLARILFLVKVGFSVLFALLFLNYLFRLKTTKYSASSQRLIVEEGSWHSVNKPYELHQLGDAVIEKPALLRMFNVANLVITKPEVKLIGLRNAEYVRDVLRQGGQLEAQRADKIRWR